MEVQNIFSSNAVRSTIKTPPTAQAMAGLLDSYRSVNEQVQRRAGAANGSDALLSERIEKAHRMFISRAYTKIVRATDIISSPPPGTVNAAQSIVTELHNIAHSVSGTAGSFGYEKLSKIADELETTLSTGDTQREVMVDLVMAMAAEFLGTLVQLLNRASRAASPTQ